MLQRELNRAVANSTGETVSKIQQMGFVPLTPVPQERDPEDLILDWDRLDLLNNVALVQQPTDASPCLAYSS